MDEPSIAIALREMEFSAVLPASVLTQLSRAAEWRVLSSGSVLFREGDFHDQLYLIHAGHLALEMCIPARGCTRLLTLGPGDLAAWSSLCGEGQMTATAIALEPVQLIAFPGRTLRELCEADHHFGYRLMSRLSQALSKRLLATRLQLLDLFGSEAALPPGGEK